MEGEKSPAESSPAPHLTWLLTGGCRGVGKDSPAPYEQPRLSNTTRSRGGTPRPASNVNLKTPNLSHPPPHVVGYVADEVTRRDFPLPPHVGSYKAFSSRTPSSPLLNAGNAPRTVRADVAPSRPESVSGPPGLPRGVSSSGIPSQERPCTRGAGRLPPDRTRWGSVHPPDADRCTDPSAGPPPPSRGLGSGLHAATGAGPTRKVPARLRVRDLKTHSKPAS